MLIFHCDKLSSGSIVDPLKARPRVPAWTAGVREGFLEEETFE